MMLPDEVEVLVVSNVKMEGEEGLLFRCVSFTTACQKEVIGAVVQRCQSTDQHRMTTHRILLQKQHHQHYQQQQVFGKQLHLRSIKSFEAEPHGWFSKSNTLKIHLRNNEAALLFAFASADRDAVLDRLLKVLAISSL